MKMLFGLAVVLSGLVWSSPAPAQDEATEKARARFFQGVELYKEGIFEAALAEFKQAYQLSPSYRVLYNVGQTYFELHDYANSYLTLKEYVQRGGDELSANRRAQVDELFQKLEKRIARIDVDCNVEGADIRVDEISAGISPLPLPILVNSGPRRISAVKAGYPVTAQIVTVAGGEEVKLRLEMLAISDGRTKPATSVTGAIVKSPTETLESEPTKKPRRTMLTASVAAASTCAVATGIFGWLLLSAKSDFDAEVSKNPYSRSKAEDIRSRALTYQYLTDGFGIAALLAGGAALYLALSDSGGQAQPRNSSLKQTVAVAPSMGGVVVHGTW
jgi:tetratricopeptide (TPR) repeat protein